MKRKDGKLVKNMDSIHKIMPFLMVNRTESEVYMTETFDITDLMKYIDKKNKNSENKITLFHAVIAAFSKTIYNRPLLNRFIAGKRYYDRNDISFGFIAKNKLTDNSEERIIILKVKENMKLDDITNFITKRVEKTRKENTNSINNTLGLVTMLPRPILSFIMWFFRKLDFYGLVPSFISDDDLNYSTVLISNLGSIKSDCCYHHLNNYGTNSIVATIGTIKEENKRKYVSIAFTADERIADGFYFAKSIKLLKQILENPIYLEKDLNEKVEIQNKK